MGMHTHYVKDLLIKCSPAQCKSRPKITKGRTVGDTNSKHHSIARWKRSIAPDGVPTTYSLVGLMFQFHSCIANCTNTGTPQRYEVPRHAYPTNLVGFLFVLVLFIYTPWSMNIIMCVCLIYKSIGLDCTFKNDLAVIISKLA